MAGKGRIDPDAERIKKEQRESRYDRSQSLQAFIFSGFKTKRRRDKDDVTAQDLAEAAKIILEEQIEVFSAFNKQYRKEENTFKQEVRKQHDEKVRSIVHEIEKSRGHIANAKSGLGLGYSKKELKQINRKAILSMIKFYKKYGVEPSE